MTDRQGSHGGVAAGSVVARLPAGAGSRLAGRDAPRHCGRRSGLPSGPVQARRPRSRMACSSPVVPLRERRIYCFQAEARAAHGETTAGRTIAIWSGSTEMLVGDPLVVGDQLRPPPRAGERTANSGGRQGHPQSQTRRSFDALRGNSPPPRTRVWDQALQVVVTRPAQTCG